MNALVKSSAINIIVTVGVAVFVILLPIIDNIVSKKAGLKLQGGLSSNPRALTLLRLRQTLLVIVFGLYLAACAWLVFFSRVASENYSINSVLMKSLHTTIHYETGIFGALLNFLRGLFVHDQNGVNIRAFKDLAQVYLNIMLFVPLGYLLPYVFHYFRDGHRYRRTVVLGFVCSMLIENLQLITKRGLYDVDDLIANTLGTLIGCFIFSQLAYVVTHPDWRKQLKLRKKWMKLAEGSAMPPLAKYMRVSRMTLYASDRDEILKFYVEKLGFRPIAQSKDAHGNIRSMLVKMGSARIEFIFDMDTIPQHQRISLYAGNVELVANRLRKSGIEIERMYEDRYERRACAEVIGPDGTKIVWID